jgi:hypothetical protein
LGDHDWIGKYLCTPLNQLKSKFEPYFEQCFTSPSRVVLKSGGNYVALNADDELAQHYEKAELEKIALKHPKFYLIEFNNLDC